MSQKRGFESELSLLQLQVRKYLKNPSFKCACYFLFGVYVAGGVHSWLSYAFSFFIDVGFKIKTALLFFFCYCFLLLTLCLLIYSYPGVSHCFFREDVYNAGMSVCFRDLKKPTKQKSCFAYRVKFEFLDLSSYLPHLCVAKVNPNIRAEQNNLLRYRNLNSCTWKDKNVLPS